MFRTVPLSIIRSFSLYARQWCMSYRFADSLRAGSGRNWFRRGWKNVEEFKYLGTTLTNQNSIAEEIKSRLRSGNACYHSVQNLLSSRLLSKNLKIQIYRTIIFPVVLYGCETSSVTLREERKLSVFENTVLRRIFGPRREEVTGE